MTESRVPRPGPAPRATLVNADEPSRYTYLLIDGENIDATIGLSVLGHKPEQGERPRWERVVDFAARTFGQPVKPLFFLNASNGYVPVAFVQALLAMKYRPIMLAGDPGQKAVDIGIQKMMAALVDRPGDVMLASHDGDFLDGIQSLLGPDRRVGLLGFREYVNLGFANLADSGLEMFDLEDDVDCFTVALPRARIINVNDFDPLKYL